MNTVEKESAAGNVLALVGLIIVVIIGLWGLIHIVSISRGFFGGLFPSSSHAITIQAPATARSGEPVLIAWNYAPTTAGAFSFVYQCQTGLQFATPKSDGDVTIIPCGTPFPVGTTTRSMTLIPSLSGASTTVPFSVIYTPGGTAASAFGSAASIAGVQGSASVTITPGARLATPHITTPAPYTKATVSHPIAKTTNTVVATPADLSVRVISASTGVVVFDIKNVGGRTSGSYTFTVELPTNEAYVYQSVTQTALKPGSHVTNTLRYDNIAPQGGTATVYVHPNGADSRTSNNSATISIGGY